MPGVIREMLKKPGEWKGLTLDHISVLHDFFTESLSRRSMQWVGEYDLAADDPEIREIVKLMKLDLTKVRDALRRAEPCGITYRYKKEAASRPGWKGEPREGWAIRETWRKRIAAFVEAERKTKKKP